MGLVRNGPPEELMLTIAARCGMHTFVETGTYQGATARWASEHFDRVVTIERAPELHEAAVELSRGRDNIELRLGDSREVLPTVVEELAGPTIFWLDGHWSGGVTYGAEDECPLLEELAAIHSSRGKHALFIDDAHLFASAPPRPHDPEQWPSIDDVILALQSPERRYGIAVIDDVIVAVPNAARADLVSYAQKVNTEALRATGGVRSLVRRSVDRVVGKATTSRTPGDGLGPSRVE